ncbi:tripartite tricarboxylate transporter permease [Vibrio sp. CK2-1]|uniref:tripartite tricarboxylate transporter permease n=1 Tax=Vibrio sp. CK2-1 TaxID=2912249 RepID=UPI001F375B76|nr:tripartite tricarboxylate transporter permease [Vibrio sp. CK2-1]MCF7353170.1 tripartite tricarboxylate transporter permease [Vibrio sp. CK2-1]
MFEQFIHFFNVMFDLITKPENIFILFGSSFLGILFGSMPGLTATLGVALLTTLTYNLETSTALISLLGMYVGAIYGGSYPAILINIPGTPAAAATAIDGYALAKKGEGGKALGLTTTASFIGTVIGLIFLVVLAPVISQFALQFTSWEFFLLAIFGIIISGTLANDDLVIKGWIAGFIGLFLALVGRDTLQFFPRYTFEQSQLDSGLEIVPVLIGAFAIPQIIRVLSEGETLKKAEKIGRILPNFSKVIRNIKHIFRSALAGVGIGAVPGVGEDIAGWVSYSMAKSTSSDKEKEKFGKGSETGIIATETANNASIGGALIPLLTLGIPGSPPAAMLLGALLLHGVIPGPTIEAENPGFLLEVTAIMVLASFAMFINGILLAKPVIKILSIPSQLFIPIVGVLCILGAYALGLNLFNLYLMLPVGIVAYILSENKFPISPMVIGLVLGQMADESLRRALMISEGSFLPLFSRPVCLVLLVVILYLVLSQFKPINEAVRSLFSKKGMKNSPGVDHE